MPCSARPHRIRITRISLDSVFYAKNLRGTFAALSSRQTALTGFFRYADLYCFIRWKIKSWSE